MLLTVVNGSPVRNALKISRKIFLVKIGTLSTLKRYQIFPRSNLGTCFRHSDSLIKREKERKKNLDTSNLANFFHHKNSA